MPSIDLALYGVHVAFWGSFAVADYVFRSGPAVAPESDAGAPSVRRTETAAGSRALLIPHYIAFFALYLGISEAVLPAKVPDWFPGQRIVGVVVIALGAVMVAWARLHFRSWRFRAQLDAGHQLATSGPFAIVRHPIYLGFNLLALGSAIWVPTIIVWVSTVLMFVGSDLRARAEEKLLIVGFGAAYRDYCGHTRRFIPGLY